MHPLRQQSLVIPECQRIQEQMQFVDQIAREEGVDEMAAAVRQDVLSGLFLQCTHRLDHVAANDRKVAPRWLLQRP